MPTELRRVVVRKLAQCCDHRRKRLVVALEPGDVITFREERSRKRFSAPLCRVYRAVVQWNVDAERAARKHRRRNAT
jgi:hypothetical protein